MPTQKSALTTLHISAFLLAATGIFSQVIQLPAWDITGYRTWIAAVILFIYVWWSEGSIALRSARDYARMLFLGIFLGIHWITFFYSMQVSNIAIGMISLYIYPVMTVFMEPLLKKTKIDWVDVVSGCFVLLGIYCLVPEFNFSNNMTQGVLWGVLSAFTFAVRNLMLGYWFSGQSSARSLSYQVLIIAVLLTPVVLTSTHNPTYQDLWLLLILGVVFTALSHALLGSSLRYLKAKTVGLVACMQPVYGVLFGVIFLNSIPNAWTIIGGAIIVATAFFESVREHKKSVSKA